jgi:hypothetical protein
MVLTITEFNITGPQFNNIPAFSAFCSGREDGYGLGNNYTQCGVNDDGLGNRGVKAHLLPAEMGTGAHIEVAYMITELNAPYVFE